MTIWQLFADYGYDGDSLLESFDTEEAANAALSKCQKHKGQEPERPNGNDYQGEPWTRHAELWNAWQERAPYGKTCCEGYFIREVAVTRAVPASAVPEVSEDGALTDEAIGKWQDDVLAELMDGLKTIGLSGDIDGGGCDSGDWRDFTLAEIRDFVCTVSDWHFDNAKDGRYEYLTGKLAEVTKERDGLLAQVLNLSGHFNVMCERLGLPDGVLPQVISDAVTALSFESRRNAMLWKEAAGRVSEVSEGQLEAALVATWPSIVWPSYRANFPAEYASFIARMRAALVAAFGKVGKS